VAPVVRRQIAVSMKSSIPRNQVPKNRQEPAEAAASAGQVVDIQELTVLQTIAKKEKVPTCLYITAWVNNQPLKRTLMDSGSAVNLIGPAMVRQLGLSPRPTTETSWNLRVASDYLIPITEEVEMNVNVVGMAIKTVAFILGSGVAYDLLLSRSWMESVGAIEDFKNKKFTIAGPNGQRIKVSPTPEEDLKGQDSVLEPRYTQEDLEHEEAEEAVDSIFKELDKDLFKPEFSLSEND
jgi:hypothetical protein